MEGPSTATSASTQRPVPERAQAASKARVRGATARLAARWIALRSLLVGSLATLFDVSTLTLLVHGLDVDPRVASLPALTLGVGLQFVGNKLFAFQDRRPDWGKQGVQFLAVEVLGVCCNLGAFHLAVSLTSLPIIPLRLAISSAVYFGICLPLWAKIFRAPSALGRDSLA